MGARERHLHTERLIPAGVHELNRPLDRPALHAVLVREIGWPALVLLGARKLGQGHTILLFQKPETFR